MFFDVGNKNHFNVLGRFLMNPKGHWHVFVCHLPGKL